MIVKAPVNCVRAAELQCRYGAKEVYLGLSSDAFNSLSFTGRGNIKIDKKTTSNITSVDDLKKIISICHENGTSVSVAANCPSLPDTVKDAYVEYVNGVIDCGVDSIIVGDIASLLIIKENVKKKVKVVSSVFLDVFNQGGIEMLKELGVQEVILPHHVTMQEIEQVCNLGVDIGLFANYSCSFNNGRCTMVHRWGEKMDLGIPCRGCYSVKNNNSQEVFNGNFLDFGEDCCLCTLKKLMDIGICSIKMIDRAVPVEQSLPFTIVYAKAIEMFENGAELEDVKRMAYSAVPWWEEQFCKEGRCRYMKNNYTEFYV